MPVPTLVTDLSTTVASNSPAGSDNVFPDLDNYLRALSGFIASIRDNSGNGWVSPYLPLTYSAGTANGVVYLNGSKVVTTGSALVFDGSNLGLGVTPSAWSGVVAMQLPTGAALTGFSNTTNLAQNAYYNGSWRYISTAAAALAQVTQGAHQWFTAPSGTAGTTISFTQAMTLDASGNLGVGTSSPAQRLDVVTTSATVAKFTRDLATDVSLTIGADNDGAIIGTDGVNVMRMFTGGSERARITSGGDLLVGTTTGNAAQGRIAAEFPGSANAVITTNATASSGTRYHMAFYENWVERGSITSNGTNTAYNTSSDRRLKENIAPAADAGVVIDAIEVVQHDWKAGGHTRYGVVAQDLNTVAPEAVTQGDDGDEIVRTWGVDYSKLVPMLIKEIQSLRLRVAALEAA